VCFKNFSCSIGALPQSETDTIMIPKERLDQMIQTETIPHALLFVGGGSEKAAYEFAKDVICLSGAHHAKKVESKAHPDLHIYQPEGKLGMHPIQALRELSLEASMASFESKWKVFIIEMAERMLPTSANALLKTLEEPPPFTLILLLSNRPEKILPTLRSRCQTIEFPFYQHSQVEILKFLAHKISKEDFEKKYQEQLIQDSAFQTAFFETIMLWYRDRELIEMGDEGKKYLTFPEWVPFIEKTPPLSLIKLEKNLKMARLAMERSIKVSYCLDFLF